MNWAFVHPSSYRNGSAALSLLLSSLIEDDDDPSPPTPPAPALAAPPAKPLPAPPGALFIEFFVNVNAPAPSSATVVDSVPSLLAPEPRR